MRTTLSQPEFLSLLVDPLIFSLVGCSGAAVVEARANTGRPGARNENGTTRPDGLKALAKGIPPYVVAATSEAASNSSRHLWNFNISTFVFMRRNDGEVRREVVATERAVGIPS